MIVIGFCGVAFAADPKTIYEQSTEALYNLDFNTAQRGYETLTREYPDNPDYWNALASSIWLRILYNQQKLSIESFSGGSLGTRESGLLECAGVLHLAAHYVRPGEAEHGKLRRIVVRNEGFEGRRESR